MRAIEAERLKQEAEKLAEQERIRKGKILHPFIFFNFVF